MTTEQSWNVETALKDLSYAKKIQESERPILHLQETFYRLTFLTTGYALSDILPK